MASNENYFMNPTTQLQQTTLTTTVTITEKTQNNWAVATLQFLDCQKRVSTSKKVCLHHFWS